MADRKLDFASADDIAILKRELREPRPDRVFFVADAFRAGLSLEEIYALTHIDRWFLDRIAELVEVEAQVKTGGFAALDAARMRALKRKGFSDARVAALLATDEAAVRKLRHAFNVHPVYKRVDSCAAEFATTTAYLYSTYEEEVRSAADHARKDHGARRRANHRSGHRVRPTVACMRLALREDGFETIAVNCNPGAVSTDYDTSDRLLRAR